MTSDGDLFKPIRFCILSPVLPGVGACLRQLQATDNGHYLNELVTHVICDDPNHVRLSEAVDLFDIKTIVTSKWVLWCVYCKALLPTLPFSPSYKGVFSNCVFGICTKDLSEIDRSRLWCMVRYYGGLWSSVLTKCTHIIATETITVKDIFIVSPDYVTECIKSDMRLPEEKYDPKHLTVNDTSPKSRTLTPTLDYNWSQSLNVVNENKDKFLEGCHFYFVDYEFLVPTAELKEWCEVIKFYGGVVETEYDPSVITHLICEHRYSNCYKLSFADGRPRLVTAYWLNDIVKRRCVCLPWLPYHFPLIFPTSRRAELPLRSHVISVTGFLGEERDVIKIMIALLGGKYTGDLTPMNSILIARQPGGPKCEKAGQWKIPVVNAQWLVELLLGNRLVLRKPIHSDYTRLENVNHLGIDRCFIQQFLPPWKQTPNNTSSPKSTKVSPENLNKLSLETKSDEAHGFAEKIDSDSSILAPKSFARPCCSDVVPVISLTGFSQRQVKELLQRISSLEGRIAENYYDTTHLVARKFVRTTKFMKCINFCTYVLNYEWILDSFKEGKFLKPTPSHFLTDDDVFYAYGFRISYALDRKEPVFTGLTFFCTPSVDPPADVLYSVISSGGGNTCYHLPTLNDIEEKYGGKNNFIILSCKDDLIVFQDCLSQGLIVLTADFVLDNLFRLTLDYDSYRMSSEMSE